MVAGDAELAEVLEMVGSGYFSSDDPWRFRPLVRRLLEEGA